MKLSEIQVVSSYWGLNVVASKVLSERAFLLRTDNGGRFILKKKVSIETFQFEVQLLSHIKNDKFPTHFPLENNLGELTLKYNEMYFSIYPYLEGTPFNAEECLNTPTIPRNLGETIATLHKSLATLETPDALTNSDLYSVLFDWAIKEILRIDHDKVLTNIFKELKVELKKRVNFLLTQIIHRDAHIYNILYKDNKLSGIIDFEIAEVNVRIFDICYCSTSILNRVFLNEELKDKWILFVKEIVFEYHKINPLNEVEVNSIWHIMLAIQVIFMASFKDYSSIYEINKKMLIWLYENKEKIN
ncbi:phosphotransferase enzyme family protein [Sutcliffiella horikoshii]|uniref:phosphotransferase enzyme family protein n=1 Tax=Sutcliffiella horikoshii TaxID=79883 RepID=UPI001F44F5C8|nr:phosphotransferase [Sutcliffiella horikoshii]MCG1020135.1 hypothetical protein [Sutcliffiella horikoshii]